VGAYINQDPIGLRGGVNQHSYVKNPLVWIDPLGLVDLNLFPTNQNIYHYADNVPSDLNVFTVGAHGNPDNIEGPDGRIITPQQLANMIKASPKYHSGETVYLLSCETGKGSNPFAKQLAQELGATVRAPDTLLWYYSDGRTPVPAEKDSQNHIDLTRPGAMHDFNP
jgi:uncharacterized protein RhaS with RHS repeats